MVADAGLGIGNSKPETQISKPDSNSPTKHTKGKVSVRVKVKVKEKGKNTSAISAAFCKIWIEVAGGSVRMYADGERCFSENS